MSVNFSLISFFGTGTYVNTLRDLNPPNIFINGTEVLYCNSVVNLGVTFDSTLSWSKTFFLVLHNRKNYSFMPKFMREIIFNTLLFSIFDYGSVLFTDIPVTVDIKLQRAQNASIRFVCWARKYIMSPICIRNLNG